MSLKLIALPNSIRFTSQLYPKLSKLSIQVFSDEEFKPDIEESVRGKRVVICGCLKSMNNVGEMLMIADAAKRGGAREIIAMVTYLPFMRQDRKDTPRTSIGAKVIANILESGNAINQLITLDLHAAQIEGFFNIPIVHLMGYKIFCPFLEKNFDMSEFKLVSPDAGGVKRTEKFLEEMKMPQNNMAVIYKIRKEANKVDSMHLLGDVKGYNAVIVDDMVDTGGSLVKAVDLLLENGARNVYACITHPVLSGAAVEKIRNSKITKLFVTDSIPLSDEAKALPNIEIISSVKIFNSAIRAIEEKTSLSKLI